MTSEQERVLEACRRTQSFLDANNTLLDTINKSTTRKELDGVAAALADSAAEQATGHITAQGESANTRVLRLALRDHMHRIAAIAALRLRTVPQFASLTMPNPHASAISLVARATAMGNAAEPFQETFLDAGLPADFLATLRAAAAALETSRKLGGDARGQRSNATGALKQLVSRARRVLKSLNPVVGHTLSADPAHAGLLAEWRAARHVGRKPGPASGSVQAAAALAAQPAAVGVSVGAAAPAATAAQPSQAEPPAQTVAAT